MSFSVSASSIVGLGKLFFFFSIYLLCMIFNLYHPPLTQPLVKCGILPLPGDVDVAVVFFVVLSLP